MTMPDHEHDSAPLGELTRDPLRPVKVTVSDPDSGQVFEERVVQNDYLLVTAGNRYVKSVQVMGRTHMIAVAVAKPGGAA